LLEYYKYHSGTPKCFQMHSTQAIDTALSTTQAIDTALSTNQAIDTSLSTAQPSSDTNISFFSCAAITSITQRLQICLQIYAIITITHELQNLSLKCSYYMHHVLTFFFSNTKLSLTRYSLLLAFLV
jgi:hypothetical protein